MLTSCFFLTEPVFSFKTLLIRKILHGGNLKSPPLKANPLPIRCILKKSISFWVPTWIPGLVNNSFTSKVNEFCTASSFKHYHVLDKKPRQRKSDRQLATHTDRWLVEVRRDWPLIGAWGADAFRRGVLVAGVDELTQKEQTLAERREEGMVRDDAERSESVLFRPLKIHNNR